MKQEERIYPAPTYQNPTIKSERVSDTKGDSNAKAVEKIVYVDKIVEK